MKGLLAAYISLEHELKIRFYDRLVAKLKWSLLTSGNSLAILTLAIQAQQASMYMYHVTTHLRVPFTEAYARKSHQCQMPVLLLLGL